MLKGHYFITATDTEVGKTYVSCYLMQKARGYGMRTLGLKPVAAGGDEGVNEDAEQLKAASSLSLPLHLVNPYFLAAPCSPNIAASAEGTNLDAERIAQSVNQLRSQYQNELELMLVEGAGGWCVPLSEDALWADVVRLLDMPVIFVVALRLGCINHAILTEKALKADGIKIHGWVANQMSETPMFKQKENIETLKHFLTSPLIDVVPYKTDSLVDEILNLDNLIEL